MSRIRPLAAVASAAVLAVSLAACASSPGASPSGDADEGYVTPGKLTVARLVAERTGIALFHNHLVVDAVAAVFPFGSPEFIRLREHFWIETIAAVGRKAQGAMASVGVEAPALRHPAQGGALIFAAQLRELDERMLAAEPAGLAP